MRCLHICEPSKQTRQRQSAQRTNTSRLHTKKKLHTRPPASQWVGLYMVGNAQLKSVNCGPGGRGTLEHLLNWSHHRIEHTTR